MGELYALMECGWENLHSMDPYENKEDVIGEIKVQDLASAFDYYRFELNR
jgi:hypothetical protein